MAHEPRTLSTRTSTLLLLVGLLYVHPGRHMQRRMGAPTLGGIYQCLSKVSVVERKRKAVWEILQTGFGDRQRYSRQEEDSEPESGSQRKFERISFLFTFTCLVLLPRSEAEPYVLEKRRPSLEKKVGSSRVSFFSA